MGLFWLGVGIGEIFWVMVGDDVYFWGGGGWWWVVVGGGGWWCVLVRFIIAH